MQFDRDLKSSHRALLGCLNAIGRVIKVPTQAFANAPGFSLVKEQADQTSAEIVMAKLQRSTGALNPQKDIRGGILSIVDPPKSTK